MSETQTNTMPRHIGVILDGNRRWAKAHDLPTMDGHKKGYENLKDIAKHAFDRGVNFVSAYVFSTENWKRSTEEVEYLMRLLVWIAKNEIKELDRHNIRVIFLGEKDRLTKQVLDAMDSAEKRTSQNDGGTLLICLNYGGHQEIISAVNSALEKNPQIRRVTSKMIQEHLYHPEVPGVDLVIRTSGERRLSNFMLWRTAYSELYFVDKHWPDFTEGDLDAALQDYAKRNRRFGGD